MFRLPATTILRTALISRSPLSKTIRNLATVTHERPTTFRQKTFKEAWLMDSGAYPIMGLMTFVVFMATGTMLHIVSTTPDARLSKIKRSQLFRGELKEVK